MKNNIILAVKSAPEKKILSNAQKAGLGAVELYLSEGIMRDLNTVIKVCRNFSFKYAVHAPNDSFNPGGLARLVNAIEARVVVFHNIFWEDEWVKIAETFKGIKTKLCIENTHSVHEPLKFMRRYGMGRCLDIEHYQMECLGICEDIAIPVIKEASHIHLTGYVYGSRLWHTHIHYSPEAGCHWLDLITKAGYSGLVVSEAGKSLQTYEEFKRLNDFFKDWVAKDG